MWWWSTVGKYDDPSCLYREKLRQERLERCGLTVVRVTYADVTRDSVATGARYARALARTHHYPPAFTWRTAAWEPSRTA